MKIFQFFISKSLLVNLVSIFVVIAGMISLFNMKREAYPHVYMDMVQVEVKYPSASPKEVEKLVTQPVEEALFEIDHIKDVKSIAVEGFSLSIATLDEDAPNKDKIKNDIQRAIDRIEDLPEDVENPIVREISTSQMPIIEITLTGKLSEVELRKWASQIENNLEDISDIARLAKNGYRDREIWVEADPEKLHTYHISFSELVQSLNQKNINLPGGELKTIDQEFLIRTLGEFSTPSEIEEVIIRSNDFGHMAQVKNIATVTDTFEKEKILRKALGQRSIGIVVLKKESADIISVVEKVKERIEKLKTQFPKELKVIYANDISYYVQRRLNILTSNAWVGMLLVIVCLLLFLSPRMSFITALGIPVALGISALVFDYFDLSINLVSMFGLVIVLGMLVDDSIVAAENIYHHLENGMAPREAAYVGVSQVIKPVLATVTTTIAAFLPLAFMEGIMGKFVWQIPAVVIICLTASLLECFFILPSHCADWLKAIKKSDHQKSALKESKWYRCLLLRYMKMLRFSLKHKYALTGGTLILFGALLCAAFKWKQFHLFPPDGIEFFFVRAQAPVGTPLEKTEKLMRPLEHIVSELPSEDLDTYIAQVGMTQNDPNDPFSMRGSHVGQIVVYLKPAQKRKRDSFEIIEELRRKSRNIAGFERVSFDRVNPGPPIGKPVAIQVLGEDFSTSNAMAREIENELKKLDGVYDVRIDYVEGKEELHVDVDEELAASLGLTIADIASTVRTAFEGHVATVIKKVDEDINVRVLLLEKNRTHFEDFNKIHIPNNQGRLIPLSTVAQLKKEKGIFEIRHLDRDRAITITANIDTKKISSSKVNQKMSDKFDRKIPHEKGIKIKFGGEQEDTEKSLASLKRAFVIAFMLIFVILVAVFNSFFQPFIIMMTIPFGLIGVIIAFFLHGYSFSFMALLGVVGLIGVVVNDAIVLIDFINQRHRETARAFMAVVEGARRRFRAVILTTVTTVGGLAPIAYGIGGNDPFLKPAALAISWGLIFSTFLTLLIIPCFYLIVEDVKKCIVQLPAWTGEGRDGGIGRRARLRIWWGNP